MAASCAPVYKARFSPQPRSVCALELERDATERVRKYHVSANTLWLTMRACVHPMEIIYVQEYPSIVDEN